MRSILVLIMVATFIFGCAPQESAFDFQADSFDQVVARVNDWQITLPELKVFIDSLGEEAAQYGVDPSDPQVQRRLLDQLINQEILYRAGQLLGLEDDPQAQEVPAELRKTGIAQMMRETLMSDVVISESDLQEFYRQNQEFFPVSFEEAMPLIENEVLRAILEARIAGLVEQIGEIDVMVNYGLLDEL